MQDYRVETTVSNDGSLSIKGLPFKAGDKVEVTIRGRNDAAGAGERYPLRGKSPSNTRTRLAVSPKRIGKL